MDVINVRHLVRVFVAISSLSYFTFLRLLYYFLAITNAVFVFLILSFIRSFLLAFILPSAFQVSYIILKKYSYFLNGYIC